MRSVLSLELLEPSRCVDGSIDGAPEPERRFDRKGEHMAISTAILLVAAATFSAPETGQAENQVSTPMIKAATQDFDLDLRADNYLVLRYKFSTDFGGQDVYIHPQVYGGNTSSPLSKSLIYDYQTFYFDQSGDDPAWSESEGLLTIMPYAPSNYYQIEMNFKFEGDEPEFTAEIELYLLTSYDFNLTEYDEGYDAGYGSGYDTGYNNGKADGYASGFAAGASESLNFDWIRKVFYTVQDVLNIEILPNIKIGYLIGIPLVIAIVSFVVGWFK